MKTFVIAFALLFSNLSFAQNFVRLGSCAPSMAQGSEEASAKQLAQAARLSDQDVLARLIYSEGLSTGYWKNGCQAPSTEALFVAIGWGVMNRVAKATPAQGAVYRVVFAKNQFRTSFSGKKPNPFANSFLCPESAQPYLNQGSRANAKEIYASAHTVAAGILATYQKSKIPLRYQGITNFFYPHSEFFGEMRPPWAKNSDASKNKGYVNLLNAARPCAEFYRL